MKSKSSNNNKRNRGRNPRGKPTQLAAINSLRTELVYADFYNYSSLTLTSIYKAFRGNGAYDPDVALGGHQPLAYDQISSLYSKYKVHGSRMEISIMNNQDPGGITHLNKTITMVCYPSVRATPVSNGMTNLIEQPYAQRVQTSPVLTAGARKNLTMSYRTTSEVFGQNTSDQDFAADVTANPVKEWYWVIWMGCEGQEPIDVSITVKIYYDVTFFARKTLSSS